MNDYTNSKSMKSELSNNAYSYQNCLQSPSSSINRKSLHQLKIKESFIDENSIQNNENNNKQNINTVSTFIIHNNNNKKNSIIYRENVKVLSNICQKMTGKRFSQFRY
jgi:hypothetical protein